MARLKISALALLVCTLFVSCGTDEVDSKDVYESFRVVFLTPEDWDARMEQGLTATPEFYEKLSAVTESIRKDRNAYASRCEGFTDPTSTACQSVKELDDVLAALADVDRTVRNGGRLAGSMTGLLTFGMSDDHRSARSQVAERVRSYFE